MLGAAQQARVMVCGAEGAGQGHLGPALLAALEGLPVHAVGLPSLLSDANSRCPLPPSLLPDRCHAEPKHTVGDVSLLF